MPSAARLAQPALPLQLLAVLAVLLEPAEPYPRIQDAAVPLLDSGRGLQDLGRLGTARAEVVKTPTDLLHKFGYPSEVHEVVTEDGYVLRLDRIPRRDRPVAYIAHGMQTSASAFILLGPENALALLLYDAGYDVWLANFRGSVYSQRHLNLTTKDNKFWRYSWHEHGVYDNPANIEYILRETGQRDLLYAGHSMGSTAFLVMASARPESQRWVRAAFLASPASYFQHSRSLIFRLVAIPVKLYEALFHTRAQSRPTWYYRILGRIGAAICPHVNDVCAFVFNFIVGWRPRAYYWKHIPDFFDYIPAGGSTGEILHYLQQAFDTKPEFRMYDHGTENRKLYGEDKPPLYNLTSIKVPVFLYLGPNDLLCNLKDMEVLKANLPSLQKAVVATDPYFNHIDPMTAPDAAERMFNFMLRDMQPYTTPSRV